MQTTEYKHYELGIRATAFLLDVPHAPKYPLRVWPEEVDIVWPPVWEVRNHYLIVFTFLQTHIMAAEIGQIPDVGIEKVVPLSWLQRIHDTLLAAPRDEEMVVEFEDVVYAYMSFHIMNRILVSEHDDVISTRALEQLNSDHRLKDPKAFRDAMITRNNAQIRLMCPLYPYFHNFRRENYQLERWNMRYNNGEW